MYKPEGGKPFDIHQDAAYMGWVQPVWNWTCWIALDDTYADGGTLVYVRGSHKWGPQPTPGTQIIAKDMDSWTDEPYRVSRRVFYLSPASWTRFCSRW